MAIVRASPTLPRSRVGDDATASRDEGVSDPLGCGLDESPGAKGGSLTPNLLHVSDINQHHRGRRRDSRERPRYCCRTTYRGQSSATSVIDCAAAAHAGGNTAPQGAFPPVFPLRPEGNAYQSRGGRRSGPRTIHSPRDRRSMCSLRPGHLAEIALRSAYTSSSGVKRNRQADVTSIASKRLAPVPGSGRDDRQH